MTSATKDKQTRLQEKYQAILNAMLREEENKYCADCDSKGPRWASWNLGVFLCIRCAGIHRKLGVHITKVKSINLDQWTAEQIASIQSMGNSKARAVYECNLSDNFRRSQTDSAMEQFIRSKYENQKWIQKDWRPTPVVVPAELLEDDRDKKKADGVKLELKKPESSVAAAKPATSISTNSKTSNQTAAQKENKPSSTTPFPEPFLLNFDDPIIPDNRKPSNNGPQQTSSAMDDFFSQLGPAQQPTTASIPAQTTTSNSEFMGLEFDGTTKTMATGAGVDKNSIMALFNMKPPAPPATATTTPAQSNPASSFPHSMSSNMINPQHGQSNFMSMSGNQGGHQQQLTSMMANNFSLNKTPFDQRNLFNFNAATPQNNNASLTAGHSLNHLNLTNNNFQANLPGGGINAYNNNALMSNMGGQTAPVNNPMNNMNLFGNNQVVNNSNTNNNLFANMSGTLSSDLWQ